MKSTLSRIALICSVIAEKAPVTKGVPVIPPGLEQALLALVDGTDTNCLANSDCDMCKAAKCTPCNLESAGAYAWKNIDATHFKKLAPYNIAENNFACVGAGDKSKCVHLNAIFLNAQENDALVPQDQFVPVTYSCNAADVLKDELITLATMDTDPVCKGHADCRECMAAGCAVCALNAVGDYAFDPTNLFFTAAQLRSFTEGQISSKLICGGFVYECLDVAAATEKAADDLKLPENWKRVGVNDCGALSTPVSASAILSMIAALI